MKKFFIGMYRAMKDSIYDRLIFPKEYKIKGLKAIRFWQNPENEKYIIINYLTPNKSPISIIRDDVGVHVCNNGKFWPDIHGFVSIERAIHILILNLEEVVTFFDKVVEEAKRPKNRHEIAAENAEGMFNLMTLLSKRK